MLGQLSAAVGTRRTLEPVTSELRYVNHRLMTAQTESERVNCFSSAKFGAAVSLLHSVWLST